MKDLIDVWRGEFGDDYTNRNSIDSDLLDARTNFWFSNVLASIGSVPKTILEVGAGNGQNLIAIDRAVKNIQSRMLGVNTTLSALEPNSKARDNIRKELPEVKLKDGTILELPYESASQELVFTSGVLIHIHPNNLKKAMSEIYRVSSKFIVCVEYFSDVPREVNYRGNKGLLWTRDFGDYYLENFRLNIVNYGFQWKRVTGLDNLTWWIFTKSH